MKKAAVIIFLLFRAGLSAWSQIPQFVTNTNASDSLSSVILKNIKVCDFALSYERSSYWTSDRKDFRVLVLTGKTYSLYSFHSKRNNDGSWSPLIKKVSSFSASIANSLIQKLSLEGFWNLNNDSLNNQKTVLHDATNYRFEVVKPGAYKVINSYAPEYFLEEMPWSIDRKTFIICRDIIENAFLRKN